MWAMRGIFDRDRPDLTLLDMMIMMGQNFIDEENGLDEEEYEYDQYYC